MSTITNDATLPKRQVNPDPSMDLVAHGRPGSASAGGRARVLTHDALDGAGKHLSAASPCGSTSMKVRYVVDRALGFAATLR